jgi:polar amino acid transport system substrate-binding protein
VNVLRYLIFTSLLAAQCCLAQDHACVKTVRWFDDAPYSFRGADGGAHGLNVDIARMALKQLGCEANFVEMPWARALVELEQGRLDILPGALRKPEREVFAYFSRPINRSPNVLFMGRSAAEKYRIKQLSDLIGTNFRLGAQIDVSYGPSYDTLMKNPEFKSHVSPLTMRRSAWKMIERDRIDGLIADEVTGLLELQQLGLSDSISRTRVVVSGDPALFAFSKKSVNPDFVTAFNAAFTAMVADGRYKELAQRYLPCTVSVEKLGCN